MYICMAVYVCTKSSKTCWAVACASLSDASRSSLARVCHAGSSSLQGGCHVATVQFLDCMLLSYCGCVVPSVVLSCCCAIIVVI